MLAETNEDRKELVEVPIFFGTIFESKFEHRIDVIVDTCSESEEDYFTTFPLRNMNNGKPYLSGLGGTGSSSDIGIIVGRMAEAEVIEAFMEGRKQYGFTHSEDLAFMEEFITKAASHGPKTIWLKTAQLTKIS